MGFSSVLVLKKLDHLLLKKGNPVREKNNQNFDTYFTTLWVHSKCTHFYCLKNLEKLSTHLDNFGNKDNKQGIFLITIESLKECYEYENTML